MNRFRDPLAQLARWVVPLVTGVMILFALSGTSCRKKVVATDDTTGTPIGEYSIVLIHSQALIRQGNDTITVRVHDPSGAVAVGILVHSVAATGPVVTSSATTTDTTTRPWGCNPPLMYWGTGDADNRETIDSWAIQVGTLDTLAHTRQYYKVIGGG
jgi:hypothetical protein